MSELLQQAKKLRELYDRWWAVEAELLNCLNKLRDQLNVPSDELGADPGNIELMAHVLEGRLAREIVDEMLEKGSAE